jgi:DNA-binding response OmpR family regulator
MPTNLADKGKICAMLPTSNRPVSSTDILLIDDSLTDLRLLMDMLLARQWRVSVAFNGQSGYQQAELQQPSLILLDVQMPTLDGFGACRLLKANPKTQSIPVIFLTASNDLSQRLQGFALGGVDYIGKPFDEAEVVARVGVHRHWPSPSVESLPNSVAGVGTDAVLVMAAQKVLRQALTNPPSLDQLAALLGTNRRRINEAFGACCDMSVFAWLREERLRQAHYLVSTSDTPLAMLSDHLGFATPAHFAKAFRERFGSTPRHLRGGVRAMQAANNPAAEAAALSNQGLGP